MEESVNNLFMLLKRCMKGGVASGKKEIWQSSHIVDLDVYKLFRGAGFKIEYLHFKVSLERFRGIK
jgi:hypothetical protein